MEGQAGWFEVWLFWGL